VRCQVLWAEIGLDLDQAAGEAAPADFPDDDLAEQLAGYVERVAGKELEWEGGFDPPSLPAALARRALWRRLSR